MFWIRFSNVKGNRSAFLGFRRSIHFFWNGVQPMPSPWMATQNPPERQPATFPSSVDTHGFIGVFRTGGNEPAGRVKTKHHPNRSQDDLIQADQKTQQGCHKSPRFDPYRSRRTASSKMSLRSVDNLTSTSPSLNESSVSQRERYPARMETRSFTSTPIPAENP